MDKVKRGLSNQAIGFIPLLAFLLVDNVLGYTKSFIVSIILSLICTSVYRIFTKEKIFQFSFIPSAVVLFFYTFFLGLNITPELYAHSSLFIELLTGTILLLIYFNRKFVFSRQIIRKNYSVAVRTKARNSLNEYFLLSRLFLGCYFIHLTLITFYFISGKSIDSENLYTNFLLDYIPTIIIAIIILYEQIRVFLIKDTLQKETWLPVLNDKGKVIGSMAKSVSRQASKKYIHPVIRIIVMHQGMLYLVKRSKDEYVSAGLLDYPLTGYVLFQETIHKAVQRITKFILKDPENSPHHILNYTFENEKVKELVSLFLLKIEDEHAMSEFHGGKLWTTRQIEENLNSNLFSEYFTQEYPYIQNTILMIENMLSKSTSS